MPEKHPSAQHSLEEGSLEIPSPGLDELLLQVMMTDTIRRGY